MYSQKVVHDRLLLPKREKYKNYPTTTHVHMKAMNTIRNSKKLNSKLLSKKKEI